MADFSLQHNNGGQFAAAVAAGAPGAGNVLTGPGRLSKIIVTAQGSVATSIYDGTSTGGTLLFTVPASGTTAKETGTIYDVQIPIVTGIYVGGATNTSALTITYNKGGVNGNA